MEKQVKNILNSQTDFSSIKYQRTIFENCCQKLFFTTILKNASTK